MTTIEELLDMLGTMPRGKIFLINLYRTIERGFLDSSQVRAACNKFLSDLTVGGYLLPTSIDLVDRLGESFVANELWQESPEPILERHLLKREFILSRVTSYGGFFFSVMSRKKGMPPRPELPEPIEVSEGYIDEIITTNVRKVRHTINSGKWRDLMTADNVRLDARCIWLAPLPKLKKKIDSVALKDQADIHRDIIGLSHLDKGKHLIRLDLDLSQWPDWPSKMRRRPHGAGNGGIRFRLQYDGRERNCQWGRTVNLAHVATGNSKNLNGIPELLMEGFTISKTAVNATYLGPVIHQPEDNDSYFIDRLRKTQTMAQIVADLRRMLA